MKEQPPLSDALKTRSIKQKIKVRAPARTCLFGDHQDYLGLPVIACAIDRHIHLKAIKNELGLFNLDLPDIGLNREISIAENLVSIEPGDHFLSTLKVLRKYGCMASCGYDINIQGNIAINAGTSSSSAVVIAWVQFLLEAFGCNRPITSAFIAQVAYEAEVLEHGNPGGKMDQYSIGLGNIIYLETGDRFNYEIIKKPLPGLIVGESGLPKKTNETLAELKNGAWDSINYLKQRDSTFDIEQVEMSDLDQYLVQLPKNLQPFFYAAVANHDVTKKGLAAFKTEEIDLAKIGQLMNEHHNILKNILKITLPRIDAMIDGAIEAGAYGAKIVGSGRGGSIVVLAPQNKIEQVIDRIKQAGGTDAYLVTVDPGVTVL